MDRAGVHHDQLDGELRAAPTMVYGPASLFLYFVSAVGFLMLHGNEGVDPTEIERMATVEARFLARLGEGAGSLR